MGLGFLRVLRILLVLLAFIIFVSAVHYVRLLGGLDMGVAAFLAIYSGIAYSWALKAQAAKMNIIKSNAARCTGSLLLCVAWLITRGYATPYIFGRSYYDRNPCTEEECGDLRPLAIIVELGGVIVAILVFLEVIFAYRYERSSRALKRDTEAMGNIIVGPAPVQPEIQHAHYAPQQYVYGQAQPQPGQPLMHYPQPAMTASHQKLTMPNQDPAASYKIPQ